MSEGAPHELEHLRVRVAELERAAADQTRLTEQLRAARAAALRERDEAASALAASERQYRDLTAALPQLIWRTRPDGWHTYFNHRWVEFTGLTVAESLGHGWNPAFHPDDRQRAWDRWQRATATGAAYEIEYRLRHRDGTWRWVLGRALPLRDDGGRIVEWFGTCTDIHDQKRAEESLRDANQKLVDAERLKSEFFANVSHELRTPLTLILAPLESLLADPPTGLSAAARQTLGTMHHNAVRLLQLVSGLLDFAKLEAGKVEVRREPTPLAALTRAVVDDFRPLMDRKGVGAELACDPPEACALIDRYLYERILFNLLSNAVKFTPAGGRVTVRLDHRGERLRLAVADTGIGIAAADLGHLFQKFRQLEGAATRRFEGTGLGLALVKEFAGLLGGDVAVESRPGGGSTFTVECAAPAAVQPADAALVGRAAPAAAPEPVAPAPDDVAPGGEAPEDGAGKVLVAEDNAELAAYVAGLLRDLARVRVARDGEEALAVARAWGPDVVLSDVMMPRRDGLSLCRALKADPATRATPVVLLTALTHREALLRGWEAGADEYLFKPFHPVELTTRVRALLAARQDRRRAEEAEARARQAEKMEAIGRLAGGVAHHLNNHLTTVTGFADVLLGMAPAADPARPHLALVKDAADRAAGLVAQLLAFSRRQLLACRTVDLNAAVTDLLPDLRRQLGAGVRVVTDLDPALGLTRADPAQVAQAVRHLARNARDAMPGGGTLTLRTGNAEPAGAGPCVMLAVVDTGVGMDGPTQARVFEPFFTTKGPGLGTGLGLASVHGVVAQSGGRVTFESQPGVGTTFRIYLPRLAERVPMTAAAGHPGERVVLVVEEEPGVRGLLRYVLQGAGHAVLEAGDGAEAEAIAQRHRGEIPLLVSGVDMPCTDGRDVAAHLARLRPGLRVLFVSAAPAGDRPGLVVPGAITEFLPKPFPPQALLAAVERLLS